MIRFRRKVYEKLLDALSKKINLMKDSINENCTDLPAIDGLSDIEKLLESHHIKSGDFLETVSNMVIDGSFWITNGLIPYKDKIYVIGLISESSTGDYDRYADRVAIYNIRTNKWESSKKLKFKRGLGSYCVKDNIVCYFSHKDNRLCSYNLDTGENLDTGIAPSDYLFYSLLKMTEYKDNIYYVVNESPGFCIYKIDMSTKSISKYSSYYLGDTDISSSNFSVCYDNNYIYISDGLRIYRFDIDTRTYIQVIDLTTIASRKDSWGRMRYTGYSIDDLLINRDDLLIISRKIISLNLSTKTYKFSKSNIAGNERFAPKTCSSCLYKKTVYVKFEIDGDRRENNFFIKWFI